MKRLSPQLIAIIGFVAAALLIGAVGYFAVVAPQRSKAQAITPEIASAQFQLIAAQGVGARPVPFRASDLYRLVKAMPNADDMPGILLDLRRVAEASSVALTSVRPAPQVVLPIGYSALPVVVVVNGTYTQISNFLYRLRQDVCYTNGNLKVGGRLFLTDQLSLQAGDKDTLSATLNLNAFVYGAPPALSATAGSNTPTSPTTAMGGPPATSPQGASAAGAAGNGSTG